MTTHCLTQVSDMWSMIKKWIGFEDKQYVSKIFMESDNPILFMELVMEISSHCDTKNINKIYRTFTFNINGSDTMTREIYEMPGSGAFVQIGHSIIVYPIVLDNVRVIGFRFVCEMDKQNELNNFLKPIMMKHNISSGNTNQNQNQNQQMID